MKRKIISLVITAAVAALVAGASVSQLRASPAGTNLNCPTCAGAPQCTSSICPYCVNHACSDIP